MDELVATIAVVLLAWLIYLLPAVFLSVPVCLLGHKRAEFRWWEAGAFILPFIVWLVCFALLPAGKSLGNIVEALVLGFAVPLGAVIRVIVGARLNRTIVASAVMIGTCAWAALLALLFPELSFHWFH